MTAVKSHTRRLRAAAIANQNARYVMDHHHRQTFVLCDPEHCAATATHLASLLIAERSKGSNAGFVPTILNLQETKDPKNAIRLLKTNKEAFVIGDRCFPMPRNVSMIKCTERQAIATIGAEEIARLTAAKNAARRTHGRPDTGADLSGYNKAHVQSLDDIGLVGWLAMRGLASPDGSRRLHLSQRELAFRAEVFVAWAEKNDKPKSGSKLMVLLNQHLTSGGPKGSKKISHVAYRYDPGFKHRFYRKAAHWL